MKTLTRILSSFSLILVMIFSANSQEVFNSAPVGIGAIPPAQKLDVTGNVQFTRALMPGGNAGLPGNILLSAGILTPSWFTNGTSGQVLYSNTPGALLWSGYGYWNLNGNAGTNPINNFIGTTNDEPLAFYTDGNTITSSTYAGQIDPQYETGPTLKGNTYVGGGSPSEANFPLIGGGNNDAGNYNVGFGSGTLGQNTTGIGNVALGGYFTLILNTTGNYNVAFDRGLESNYAGSGSIGIGFDALAGQSSTASYNIGIGYEAGFVYLNGASGSGSTLPNAIGNFNTAVGYEALYIGTTTNDAVSNTALGNYTLFNNTGKQNIAVGDSALVTNTSGNYNSALGFAANVALGTYTNATAIGYNASAPASNSITLGNSADVGGTTSAITTGLYLPGYNTVGSIFYTSAGSGLVAPLVPTTSGYMLQSQGSGAAPMWANVSVTQGTVTNVTGAAPITIAPATTWVVGIQGTALDQGGVLYSAGLGNSALFTSTGTLGQVLTSAGTSAPVWANPASTAWSLTGNSNTTPGTNWIGTNDDEQFRFYIDAAPAGSIDPQFVASIAKANTYFGAPNSNNSQFTGAGNNDAGTYNVGIGFGCMGFAASTVNYNTAMGTSALEPINGESLTGSYNVSIGAGSNTYNGGANYETAIGWGAMDGGIATATTSSYNTAAGAQALSAADENGSTYYHSFNTALGYQALETPSSGAGNSITAAGTNSAYHTTGNRNTAVGDSSLYTNTSGTNNTSIGYFANTASTAINTITIGYDALAPANNSVTLGSTAVVGGTTSATTTGLYLPGYNAVGSLFYTTANGLVTGTGAGTSGYLLQSNGPGVAPTWANVIIGGSGSITNVTGTAPIVVTGSWNVGIQGNSLGTDKGGVLYSAGAGTSALFTITPASAGLILTSSAVGAPPTWVALPASVWNLTGNSGITPGTNFIGTTDANRLVFKVDNVVSGTIDLPSPTGNENVYYGYNITTDAGSNNVAVGWEAASGSGSQNIYLGRQGTVDNASITGSNDIGIGYQTMENLTSGIDNVSAGSGAFGVESGSFNTGFGYSALDRSAGNFIGKYNTGIGQQTLNAGSVLLNSNTAVGYQSQGGTESSHNTSFGSGALEIFGASGGGIMTGTYNTAVGDSVYYINTGSPTWTGNYNTGLGCLAEAGAESGSGGFTNTTSIGARADANINNSLVLGSINGTNGATANTNVGIGTNTPGSDAALAIKTGHLETQGTISSVVLGSGAGTGGTPSASIGANGATDVGGEISITTGTTGLAAGSQAIINFANNYTYSPVIVISPANAAAATAMTANGAYATSNPSGFSINFTSAPSASATYLFNYYAIETPGTSPVFNYPSYTENCVIPITITNGTTAIAAGATQSSGYQQMITVNSSLFTSENASLNNIVFTTAAPVGGVTQGSVLEAWIESGATNSSTATVYWVNLGTTGIPASSSITIYMNMVSTNVLSASGPTGEAPQLSGTYAQYDDGSLVFNNYWNFAEPSSTSTPPSGLADVVGASASITFNNGVTITNAGTPSGTYLYNTSTIAEGNVAESYFIQKTYPTEGATYAQALLASIVVNASTSLASSTTSYAGSLDLQTGQSASGGITVATNAWNFEIQDGFEIATIFPPPALAYEAANFGENIWSLGITPTGTLGFADVNYTNLVSGGSSIKNLSAGFHIGLTLTQGTALYQWVRTRTYPPGGTMPAITVGSQTCTSTTPPQTTVCYVPITLTNSQTTAVAAGTTASNGYQEMLTVNSSNYTTYESIGLQNVEFTVGAPSGEAGSTQLNSWLESGNSNTSNSTVYWLNLGTNGIAASSTLPIYINFMPSSNILSAGPSPCAGEAPQLTNTYAQYDNGSLVFNNYWNFAESSPTSTPPSGLTSANATGGQITFNNGLTINPLPSVAWGTYVVTASKINEGNVAESYFEQETFPESTTSNALCAGMIADASQTLKSSNSSYAGSVDLQTTPDGVTVPLDAWNFEIQDAYNQGSFPYPVLGYQTYNTNLNVWSLGINTTGTLGFGDVNYTNLVPGGSTTQSLSSGFYIGLSLTQETAYYQWLRTRTYPPNGVMPTAGLGSVTCE